ncbi:MAG TPA: class I tRNA ligase family protein, partial [Byssovorax sp.]
AYFPSCVHLMGKDILRFHAVYWPAFLMAAGLPLPKQVFAHGFLTYGGQKMSKTLRNTVSPVELARAISPDVGADVVRYALMRAISFGQDGDFSIEDVLGRYASELGNSLGNLLNRVIKPFGATVPAKGEVGPLEEKLAEAHAEGAAAAAKAFDDISPTRALEAIWGVIGAANEYVDRAAPWAAKKSGDAARLGTIVATLIDELEAISVMVYPVLPTVADRMRAQLGLAPISNAVDRDQWPAVAPTSEAGRALAPGEPIFPRFEKEKHAELVARFSAPKPDAPKADAPKASAHDAPKADVVATPAREAKATIAYDDFAKVELRVGVVLSAERVKKKDKLLDLRVDAGDAAPRRIVAGIAGSYAPEQLVGKRVVLLANLAPRDFGKGLVSEGMLLAADGPNGLVVTTVDGDAPPGSSVS